ncbi:MAG TPA: cysteine desulfurase family protein [Candidatus Polarisedimenticolia bacterium]|nr:cysteine desulfurase family protein [Candidatus Polarisedimenticolia bacterium]
MPHSRLIYMDHNATTPLDPRVLAAMTPFLTEHFGNASSVSHSFGLVAAGAVDAAREKVAALLGASPGEIVFTSGATESDNTAIKGTAWSYTGGGGHIVTSGIEHRAVLESCRFLETQGFTVTYVPVDADAVVDPDDVRRALRSDTILISIMHANSEVGTIQPVEAIGAVAKERGIPFHVDATQTVGKLPVAVDALNADFVAFSAHKIYGPKGTGGLYVRRRKKFVPLHSGGGQEKGRRSGTYNTPGIVGLGEACVLAAADLHAEAERLRALTRRFLDRVRGRIDGVTLNGHPERRLPNNLNLSFEHVEAEGLIAALKSVAVSSGSACASETREPSYVMKAIGASDERAHAAVRFGLGRSTTEADVDEVVDRLDDAVRRQRMMSDVA